jgi:hypothetical protein
MPMPAKYQALLRKKAKSNWSVGGGATVETKVIDCSG